MPGSKLGIFRFVVPIVLNPPGEPPGDYRRRPLSSSPASTTMAMGDDPLKAGAVIKRPLCRATNTITPARVTSSR